MSKSAQAFRTIREVADWLDVAAHVLRFWESKFSQIKPVKRAGGRRYYRPSDMALVGGIKVLLHDRGLTIRGVQKMISEDGVDAVIALSPPLDDLLDDPNVIELAPAEAWDADTSAELQAPPTEDGPAAPDAPESAALSEGPDSPELDEAPPEDAPPTEIAVPEPSADTAALEPALASDPDPATEPALLALPAYDPAEGALGQLAALSDWPTEARTRIAPHLAALRDLAQRMGHQ